MDWELGEEVLMVLLICVIFIWYENDVTFIDFKIKLIPK